MNTLSSLTSALEISNENVNELLLEIAQLDNLLEIKAELAKSKAKEIKLAIIRDAKLLKLEEDVKLESERNASNYTKRKAKKVVEPIAPALLSQPSYDFFDEVVEDVITVVEDVITVVEDVIVVVEPILSNVEPTITPLHHRIVKDKPMRDRSKDEDNDMSLEDLIAAHCGSPNKIGAASKSVSAYNKNHKEEEEIIIESTITSDYDTSEFDFDEED